MEFSLLGWFGKFPPVFVLSSSSEGILASGLLKPSSIPVKSRPIGSSFFLLTTERLLQFLKSPGHLQYVQPSIT